MVANVIISNSNTPDHFGKFTPLVLLKRKLASKFAIMLHLKEAREHTQSIFSFPVSEIDLKIYFQFYRFGKKRSNVTISKSSSIFLERTEIFLFTCGIRALHDQIDCCKRKRSHIRLRHSSKFTRCL